MFGLSLGSLGLKFALLAILMTAIGGFYWHYTVVKGERDTALMAVGALEVAAAVNSATIKDQEKAIDEWAVAQVRMQATLDAMAQAQVDANETAKELNDVLGKHDLHALSLGRPGMVERRINRGTANVLRLFESESD